MLKLTSRSYFLVQGLGLSCIFEKHLFYII